MFKKLKVLLIAILITMLIPITAVGAESNVAAVDLPQSEFEENGQTEWTSLEGEIEFLEEIESLSDRVRVTQEGESVLGKPIHLIRVGNPDVSSDEEIANGRNIFIMGTPHGNEPAGREASLSLIRDLAFTDDPELLELMDK